MMLLGCKLLEFSVCTSVKKELEMIAESREEVEALRNFSIAEYSFVTFPNIIEFLPARAGLVSLALPDDTARVPTF